MYEEDREALERAEWKRKIARMKKEQKRAKVLGYLALFGSVLAIAIIVTVVVITIKNKKPDSSDLIEAASIEAETEETVAYTEETDSSEAATEEADENNPSSMSHSGTYVYETADEVIHLGSDTMTSNNAILVNVDTNQIVGDRDCQTRINPASMTKVLTVLVAAEHITDVTKEVSMTIDATDYAYSHDCSAVGFAKDEKVTIEDLFYGTILSSGGDAAVQLAMEVAGSQDAFVDMMNEKLAELGISDTTHFTNCVGVYDENHYSSCYDMAVIMNAAIDNEYCRKIMSAHKYTTSATTEHPEGITISNWFLRRIEDKDTGGEVVCAKTGFVNQSGNCAVCYAVSAAGTPYICVTADAHSSWRCIYDHVDILSKSAK